MKVVVNDKTKAFISMLLQSRDKAHLAHFKTKSHAEHLALGAYYEQVIELADTFIESYQGEVGIIDIVIPETKIGTGEDMVVYLEKLCDLCDSVKPQFPDWLSNQIQEIQKLLYQTVYKLENLK